jgi:hypothetical protein
LRESFIAFIWVCAKQNGILLIPKKPNKKVWTFRFLNNILGTEKTDDICNNIFVNNLCFDYNQDILCFFARKQALALSWLGLLAGINCSFFMACGRTDSLFSLLLFFCSIYG